MGTWEILSEAQASSWLEIIEHYSSKTAAALDGPPSGIFTFGDELWDSSEEAVSIEEVQGETGYPQADDFWHI
jgi:hypothetical protein